MIRQRLRNRLSNSSTAVNIRKKTSSILRHENSCEPEETELDTFMQMEEEEHQAELELHKHSDKHSVDSTDGNAEWDEQSVTFGEVTVPQKEEKTVWNINDIGLSKGESREEEISVKEPGEYEFTFSKQDKLASRSVAITITLIRDGAVLAIRKGSIGALKPRIHRMEFKISKPVTIHIEFVCGALTSIGQVRFNACLTFSQSPFSAPQNNFVDKDTLEKMEENTKDNDEEQEDEQEGEEAMMERSMSIPTTELVWELKKEEMSKNQIRTWELSLQKAGMYQLIFSKLDPAVLRTLSIRVKITRDGNIIAGGKGGIGGLKWTKSHCMEFEVSRASQLEISLKCYNPTSIGAITFKAQLIKCHEKQGKPLNSYDEIDPATEMEVEEEEDKVKYAIIDSFSGKPFSKKKVLYYTLDPGHYNLGIRNDDSRVGVDYRSFDISVIARKVSDSTEVFNEYCDSLKFGDYPWRTRISITPEQGPVNLSVSLSIQSKLQGKFSMKLSEAPDPKSFPEVMKRCKMTLFKIAGFLALLLFISYASQFIGWAFSLGVGSITVRSVLTIIVGSYCYYHREEMIALILESRATVKDKLGFFKGLDELETGIQKIKYLQERSKIKQAKRRAKKQIAMRL